MHKSETILGVETTHEQNEIINHNILEVKYYIYMCANLKNATLCITELKTVSK